MKFKRNQKTAINYVSRDSRGRIIKQEETDIEDISVLMTKTSTIRNGLTIVIKNNYWKVILKSGSLIMIQVNKEESIPQKNIDHLVKVIILLAKKFDNITFIYYRIPANKLAKRIAKIHALLKLVTNEFISCYCFKYI